MLPTASTEAEYMALTEAAKEAVWLRNFLSELDIPLHTDKIKIRVDNQSAIKLSVNPEFHARTKHIELRHHYVRELVEDGQVELEYINTKENIADMLTKGLPRPQHEYLIEAIGMKRCIETSDAGEC